MSAPKTLWKYGTIQRITSVTSGMFRFSQPSALNDPFDANPDLLKRAGKNKFGRMLDEAVDQHFDEHLQNYIRRNFIPDSAVTDSFKLLIKEYMKNNLPQLESVFRDAAEQIDTLANTAFDNVIGILCLSEVNDSILMWSHYGAGHTGICIGLDADHPFFHQDRKNRDLMKIKRVKYRAKRPHREANPLDSVHVFFQKSPEWRYENEWRMIGILNESDLKLESNPGLPVHLFRIPADAISDIVFGLRHNEQSIESFLGLLKEKEELHHLRIHLAEKDSELFRINIKRIA